ncbi:hypothetical protein MAPG_02381 [Magnaporthiopsis poae ATCC 64411]|uniref:Uncharacterized protein n=1 Tax=Magnaporthiopsis poae (strain ATCC 64411 / 73-15) TaxID=644358 RepID=A0A0C4DR76_MAGP6|nr:hypothetical protein MAPG_02381 [Magnaporthiopsis poae ATCC 64411]
MPQHPEEAGEFDNWLEDPKRRQAPELGSRILQTKHDIKGRMGRLATPWKEFLRHWDGTDDAEEISPEFESYLWTRLPRPGDGNLDGHPHFVDMLTSVA